MSSVKTLIAAAGLSLLTAACANHEHKAEQKASAPAPKAAEVKKAEVKKVVNNDDFYLVHHEGRIYVFDDAKTYLSFMQVGETAYRKVFIGAGPNGETLVYGLSKKDKKKTSGIASIDMNEGRLEGAKDGFYGEIIAEDNRQYVFSTWEDLKSFRSVGAAPYRLTEIGAGREGRTLVYVLNKKNKKKRPEALRAKFKALHNS